MSQKIGYWLKRKIEILKNHFATYLLAGTYCINTAIPKKKNL